MINLDRADKNVTSRMFSRTRRTASNASNAFLSGPMKTSVFSFAMEAGTTGDIKRAGYNALGVGVMEAAIGGIAFAVAPPLGMAGMGLMRAGAAAKGLRGLSRIGSATRGLGMGLKGFSYALRGANLLSTAAIVAGAFVPPDSALGEISSYLSGEKLGNFFEEKVDLITNRGQGPGSDPNGFKMSFLENQKLVESRNRALALLGQSRSHSFLGREAEMMHN
jgi:di/tricarboxylate transporter